MRDWLTLGVAPPAKGASEVERLRFIRDLSLRSLVWSGPATIVLCIVFGVPLWGFGVLAVAILLQAASVLRLSRRIRDAEG